VKRWTPCPWWNDAFDFTGCIDPRGGEEVGLWGGVDARAVYPEYLTDYNILVCPSSARKTGDLDIDLYIYHDDGSGLCQYNGIAAVTGIFYQYLGFVIDLGDADDPVIPAALALDTFGVEQDMNAQYLSIIYAPWLQSDWGEDETATFVHDSDTQVPDFIQDIATGPIGTAGGDKHLRIREGIERFMVTDINNPGASARGQSDLPVAWDYVGGVLGDGGAWSVMQYFNHLPGSANVLYLDGHVEFEKFPGGGFPANPPAAWAHAG